MIAAAVCLTAGCVLADKVEFNNGDVLSGKITEYDGKKLTIHTEQAGDVKVELKDVKTFSTDEPIDLHLKDGTVIKQRAVAATQGSIGIDHGIVNAQTFTLNQIKTINPPPVKWTGSITVGAVVTRGNTFTDQYHAGFDLLRRAEEDRITASGSYNFGRQKDEDTGDKVTSVDNLTLQGKYDYFIPETKWYVYANALAEKDRIQDLNLRFVPGIGVGYQWVESPTLNFNTEAGLSWIYEDYTTQETTEEIAGRLAYHLDKSINDRVKLIHNLEYLPSLEDGSKFLVNTDVGLRTDLTKQFFIEAKIELTYNSQPAPDKVKNDVKYMLSVGYKF
jgi:putative salt-induced outer membrane protein YdiY